MNENGSGGSSAFVSFKFEKLIVLPSILGGVPFLKQKILVHVIQFN